jgi:acyl carrier protein
MPKSAEQTVFSLARQILPGAASQTLTRDSDLQNDLNADSLSLVSLIFAIEEEFGFENTQLGSLVTESRTLGDLVTAVEKLNSG